MKRRPARARAADQEEDLERLSAYAVPRRSRTPYALGVYIVLGLVLFATVFATVRLEHLPLVRRFGSNLATEALGIIVTLAFVQRLLAREERARKMRAAVGALRKGRVALGRLVETWSTLTKGALDPRRTEYPRSVGHLFAPYYTEEISCLDPRPRLGESGTNDWLETTARQLGEAQGKLRDVILTYGGALDPDYLEALDELADDPFVQRILQLAGEDDLSPQAWRVAVNRSRGYREAHFVRLLHAVELHNRLAHEAARFRSQHFAPSAQSLSLQLGSDRDLTVQTQLRPEWWTTFPEVGALRAQSPGQ